MEKSNFIIICLLSSLLFSCESDQKKQGKDIVQPVNKLTPANLKIRPVISSKEIYAPKEVGKKKGVIPKQTFKVKNRNAINVPNIQAGKKTEIIKPDLKENISDKLVSFVNLRKILTKCKIGQTLSQKELTQDFEIPKEAVKLVKSITRTAENELAVKWRSTWLVEKVSDAELEDGKMKVTFKANRVYTSGKAIGIKYNRKIYNDLVIIGRSAYIPSVKGYSWQIGK